MESKLVQLNEDIKNCEGKIGNLIAKKNRCKEEVSELLNKDFNKLRGFIAEKLFDNLPIDKKEKIEKKMANEKAEAEQRKLHRELFGDTITNIDSSWYSTSAISFDADFNPFKDQFEITNIQLSKNKKQVKIEVECTKLRQYLGITGAWIPSLYETDWFNIEELIENER